MAVIIGEVVLQHSRHALDRLDSGSLHVLRRRLTGVEQVTVVARFLGDFFQLGAEAGRLQHLCRMASGLRLRVIQPWEMREAEALGLAWDAAVRCKAEAAWK